MGKLFICNGPKNKPIPFLRGILTRSLQDAGLEFNQAYQLASEIRAQLNRDNEDCTMTPYELRKAVQEQLKQHHSEAVLKRYNASGVLPETIMVRLGPTQLTPFSRLQHQRDLDSCCLTREESATITNRVFEYLLERGYSEVSTEELIKLTHQYLMAEAGVEAAKHYHSWIKFQRSNIPLLILIGGAPGCGKSSIATELAHRLNIVRIQSTDMLREVMRMMLPKKVAPSLHTSSFNAWQMLPQGGEGEEGSPDKPLIDGYLAQAELVSVACEGAIQRAHKERVSLILEGVHIYPVLIEKIHSLTSQMLIVPVMLATLHPDLLKQRFKGRHKDQPERRSKRYLRQFSRIWQLQSFLLSEADNAGITIVHNSDKEAMVQEILRLIGSAIEKRCDAVKDKDKDRNR